VTTDSINRVTSAATRGDVARTLPRGLPAWSVSSGRRPLLAIVAPTTAMFRAVVSTRPWPMAEAPTSTGVFCLGIVASVAPGTPVGWLKPNRSATATSRLLPTFAPIGPKTELQDFEKDSVSEPPQASPWALEM
jgi:hypothetical protein